MVPPEEDKPGARPEFILAMSKLFVSLKLPLFLLFFTYWLFRRQKHKVNRRFHVRDMFLSSRGLYQSMSRTVKKNMKFKLLYFPNKVCYRAGKDVTKTGNGEWGMGN